jgi:hypothetical protein
MRIIGAGFSRTGTMSLRGALQQLGFKRCYHNLEVFKHPRHIKTWQAAAEGAEVDWREFLAGWDAGVDFPLAAFYAELAEVFPEAKVILSVRDPDRWYDSAKAIRRGTLPRWFPAFRSFQQVIETLFWERLFHGRFDDREYALRVFEEHTEEVRRKISPDRLLVFDVKSGWGPLCEFLGVDAPDTPFPHINDRKMQLRLQYGARLVPILLGVGVLALAIRLLSNLL